MGRWIIGILAVLIILYVITMYISFAGIMARWFPIRPEMMISKKVWVNMQPRIRQLRSMPQEEVEIKSRDGLRLVGHWIPAGNPDQAERTLLLCHGWRSSWEIDFNNAALWLHEQNCNLLLIEERAQGNSEGKYMTFGVKERLDCVDWVNWITQKCPELPIYLYGTSMGAATVLMASGEGLPIQVKGILADSGFTSPYAIIRDVGKRKFYAPHHPNMDFTCFFSKMIAGVDLRECSAQEALKKCKVPVVLIHGKKDNFVPCRMSEENYKAIAGEKKLFLFEGAGHCGSYWKHTAEYQKSVLDLFAGTL